MPNYPYSFQLPPLNVQDIPNDGAVGEFLGISAGGVLDWLPVSASGSGDLLAANNLSELTPTAGTARTNLGLGTTDTPTFKNLVISTGSIATSAPVTISQTWDALAVAFAAFKVVATDTASSTASNLLELWSGNAPTLKFNVSKAGVLVTEGLILADGNRSALRDGGVTIASGGALQWSSTSSAGSSRELFVVKDAPNTLALRNSTAAQTFNIYSTWSASDNYQRLRITPTTIISEGAGGGSAGAITIQGLTATIRSGTATSNRFVIGSTGLFGIGVTGGAGTGPSKVTVQGGDVELTTADTGIILVDSLGQRRRITVTSGGVVVASSPLA